MQNAERAKWHDATCSGGISSFCSCDGFALRIAASCSYGLAGAGSRRASAGRGAAGAPAGAARSGRRRGRLRRDRVELLDHVARQVDARIPRDDPGIGAAEQDLEALLFLNLLHERQDLLLEFELQLLLQLVDLGLRILLEALAFALSAARCPSRAAARAASLITRRSAPVSAGSTGATWPSPPPSACFFVTSALILPVEICPSTDSAATRWKSTKAIFAPAGNGAGGWGAAAGGAGRRRAPALALRGPRRGRRAGGGASARTRSRRSTRERATRRWRNVSLR